MQQESATLYFTDAGSDKVYSAQLTQAGDLFSVSFQYGRRGSALTAGTKTVYPVPYVNAKKIYDQLVKAKTAKGYTPAESGERYQDTSNAGRTTGLSPQLLNAVEEQELKALIADPGVVAQEKFDGERRILIFSESGVVGTNRNGLVVPISSRLESSILSMFTSPPAGRTVIDGEDLGDAGYAAFDLLELDGQCFRSKPYVDRLVVLERLLMKSDAFLITPVSPTSPEGKRKLLQDLRDQNAEGIVFKHANAAWSAGRPNSGGPALKFKFVASATVRAGNAKDGKRSVEMLVLCENGADVCVGYVTIPANAAIPAPGALIEVEYLYRYSSGGSLFQPVYLRTRPDKQTPDTAASLKVKAEAIAA